MLKIVQITSNPKKRKISKRLWRIRQGKSVAKVRGDTYEDAKERAAQIGFKKPESIVLIENPKKKRKRKTIACKVRKRKRKAKIIRVKKNPPRKSYQTIITGLVKTREKRFKTYYFTGKSFVRNKAEAKIFPGSTGKQEAKRILQWLPPQIESLSVERV